MTISYIDFILFCRTEAETAKADFRAIAERIRKNPLHSHKDDSIERHWKKLQCRLDRIASLMEVRGCLYEDIEAVTGKHFISVTEVIEEDEI